MTIGLMIVIGVAALFAAAPKALSFMTVAEVALVVLSTYVAIGRQVLSI